MKTPITYRPAVKLRGGLLEFNAGRMEALVKQVTGLETKLVRTDSKETPVAFVDEDGEIVAFPLTPSSGNSYYYKIAFSGRGIPPRDVRLLSPKVATGPSAIGPITEEGSTSLEEVATGLVAKGAYEAVGAVLHNLNKAALIRLLEGALARLETIRAHNKNLEAAVEIALEALTKPEARG